MRVSQKTFVRLCDILSDLCGKYKSLNHKGSQRLTQSHTKGKYIKYYF